MEPNENPSRRRALQAGLIAAPALLAGTASAQPKGDAPPLKSPLGLHPKPPFKEQKQEWPGLASKMEPKPDHGEKSYKGAGKLAGRKALVTGGDSGIGRAAAIAFAREGADVAFGYLSQEESDAKEVVELIKAEGRKAVALPGDIRDEKFCQQLVADAFKGLGGLNILVNNAAYQMAQAKGLEGITTEQLDRVFKTNVYALFWITKAALPHLPPGSAVINTASIQAYEPSKELIDYAQTKAAIVSFTKSVAKSLAEKGIRVNAVAPGPVWTPLIVTTMPPEKVTSFGADVPLTRPAQPVELAPTFVYLASAEASYVTGEVFGNTGGKSPF